MGRAEFHRRLIVDRLREISPTFLAWARHPETTRGPPPPEPPLKRAQLKVLLDKCTRLVDEK